MTVFFYCPSGHEIAAPAEIARREVQCPQCGQWVIVPPASRANPSDDEAALVLLSTPDRREPVAAADTEETTAEATDHAQSGESWIESPPDRPVDQHWRSSTGPRLTWHGLLGQPVARIPPHLHPPDRRHVKTVNRLAIALLVAALAGALPAIGYLDLGDAPGWARGALVIATIQVAYIAWMAATPDWVSVRVVMLVFAVVAAIYGGVGAMVISTPMTRLLPLTLDPVRRAAPEWCGVMLLITGLCAYLCGHISALWRRAEVCRSVKE